MIKNIILDLEIYPNFFLAGMMDINSKKIISLTYDDIPNLKKYIKNNNVTFVTFNGYHFDLRILKYILNHDPTLKEIKAFSDFIILGGTDNQKERYKYCWWNLPHIDLKMVLGGRQCPSLKKLAYRLNLEELESLPISPNKELNEEEKQLIINYNIVDLRNTLALYDHCKPILELRKTLTKLYKVNCDTLSDAQIAEKIMGGEGYWQAPKFETSHIRPIKVAIKGDYHYDDDQLKQFYEKLKTFGIQFVQGFDPIKEKQIFKKHFIDHDEIKNEVIIDLGSLKVSYKMGGLHSIHKKPIYGDLAYEIDVQSFYPHLIITKQIFPYHLGNKFVDKYKEILESRLKDKKEGRKIEADAKKIILNSTFGKYNEFYSKLRDPIAGVSVCINGELAILRLIDLCLINDINVLMVNTDGIITKQNPQNIIKQWEDEQSMPLEVKTIKKYFIKDSNNLCLRYNDDELKIKGVAFSYIPTISKQNNYPVIQKAIVNFLLNDVPLEITIKNEKNIHAFLSLYSHGQTITRVKIAHHHTDDGIDINFLIRYYMSKKDTGNLYRYNGKTWTRITDSKNIIIMNKITGFPADLCYDSYIELAKLKLEKIRK